MHVGDHGGSKNINTTIINLKLCTTIQLLIFISVKMQCFTGCCWYFNGFLQLATQKKSILGTRYVPRCLNFPTVIFGKECAYFTINENKPSLVIWIEVSHYFTMIFHLQHKGKGKGAYSSS